MPQQAVAQVMAKRTPEQIYAAHVAREELFGDGCVRYIKCQSTGATRVLYRPGTQSEDEGWFLVCDTHATCVTTETRKLGNSHLGSADWCEDCQEIERRKYAS